MARFSIDDLSRRLSWADIDPVYLQAWATLARDEDLIGEGLLQKPLQPGDATTQALGLRGAGEANLIAREALIVAGLPLISCLLAAYDKRLSFVPHVAEGAYAAAGTSLGVFKGDIVSILMAERPILNALQRLSGIATQTANYVQALGKSITRLLDTRKTTPGLRVLEKYAVACGGAYNHRLGLFDRLLIKDNHLAAQEAAAGARLALAIKQARMARPDLPLEVEVDNLEQIPFVLEAGPDIILLDNFSDDALRQAIALVSGRAYTEASGGITRERLLRLGGLGLDFISMGALTHQSTAVDIALDWSSVEKIL